MESNLKKLEYNEILQKLSTFCETTVGKTLATSLRPTNKKQEVQALLDETDEAVRLNYRASTPTFYNYEDITKYTKVLEAEGTLSIKAILELNKILKMANNLKNYFGKDYINQSDFPNLAHLFQDLYVNPGITKKISSVIIDDNMIDDKPHQN